MVALHTNEIVLAVIMIVLLVASVSALWLREHASLDEPTTPLTLSEQARSALLGKKPGALADSDQTVAERRSETKKRRDEKKAAKRARVRTERKPS